MRKVWLFALGVAALGLMSPAASGESVGYGDNTITVSPGSELALWVVLDQHVLNGATGYTGLTDTADLFDDDGEGIGLTEIDNNSFDNDGPLFTSYGSVIFEFKWAGASHSLFINDGTSRPILFSMPTSGMFTSGPTAVIPTGLLTPWEFELDVSGSGGPYTLSSDYSDNGGSSTNSGIHALVFQTNRAATGFDYLIAFEDLRSNSDYDYNDFVFTATIVPVPPAIGLILLGMGGVGALRLRRKNAKR